MQHFMLQTAILLVAAFVIGAAFGCQLRTSLKSRAPRKSVKDEGPALAEPAEPEEPGDVYSAAHGYVTMAKFIDEFPFPVSAAPAIAAMPSQIEEPVLPEPVEEESAPIAQLVDAPVPEAAQSPAFEAAKEEISEIIEEIADKAPTPPEAEDMRDETAAAEEPPMAEEPLVVDELVEAEEPPMAEEPLVVDEAAEDEEPLTAFAAPLGEADDMQDDEPAGLQEEETVETPAPPMEEEAMAPLATDEEPADVLKLIKGIDAELENRLNALGVLRYEQIANWSPADVAWINTELGFSGRVEQENWIEQAKILTSGTLTHFARGLQDAEGDEDMPQAEEEDEKPLHDDVLDEESGEDEASGEDETSGDDGNDYDNDNDNGAPGTSLSAAAIAAAASIAIAAEPDESEALPEPPQPEESAFPPQSEPPLEPIAPEPEQSGMEIETDETDTPSVSGASIAAATPFIALKVPAYKPMPGKRRRVFSGPALSASKSAAGGESRVTVSDRPIKPVPVRRAPRPAMAGDDLKKIPSINITVEKKLNALGISRYAQIAQMSADDLAAIGRQLGASHAIDPDEWTNLARRLLQRTKV